MDTRVKHLVNRGKVRVSSEDILETRISTCVSICLYHPEFKLGGITHISRCREVDTTPSGRYVKTNGYYYADTAIPRLLNLLKQQHGAIRDRGLKMVVTGGMNNEGPVSETLWELEKHEFQATGHDVNKMLHRQVIFDIAFGIVIVNRKELFANVNSPTKNFRF